MMPMGPRPGVNAESVRRDNVTREFRHGTRGESAISSRVTPHMPAVARIDGMG